MHLAHTPQEISSQSGEITRGNLPNANFSRKIHLRFFKVDFATFETLPEKSKKKSYLRKKIPFDVWGNSYVCFQGRTSTTTPLQDSLLNDPLSVTGFLLSFAQHARCGFPAKRTRRGGFKLFSTHFRSRAGGRGQQQIPFSASTAFPIINLILCTHAVSPTQKKRTERGAAGSD